MEKKVSEIKDHFLKRLNYSLARPGMYGQGRALDTFYCMLLEDLCFIENRDSSCVKDILRSKGYWTSMGVCGFLELELGVKDQIEDDLASIYVEISAQLSFVKIENVIKKEVAEALLNSENLNLEYGQVLEELGNPSFKTTGKGPCVLSYQLINYQEWLTCKFDRERKLEYLRIGQNFRFS